VCSDLSRRGLFTRLGGGEVGKRPPFSLPEAAFTDICTTCGDCIKACEENILVRGRAGYPQIDFSKGGCTFCGACADVCKVPAFRETRDEAQAWSLRAAIGANCLERKGVSCRACESHCDTRAIRFRPALGGRTDIFLELSQCTGCGACVEPCPQGAISIIEPQEPVQENLEAIA